MNMFTPDEPQEGSVNEGKGKTENQPEHFDIGRELLDWAQALVTSLIFVILCLRLSPVL
jgi:hypothetical protein